MDSAELCYNEDLRRSVADAKTNLDGAHYFFLGNGHIQAGVQICQGKIGTPVGLLIMNPEVFGRKQNSLTFDPRRGIAATALQLDCNGKKQSLQRSSIDSCWKKEIRVPVVQVRWKTRTLHVEEEFYCPDLVQARLVRRVTLCNRSKDQFGLCIKTGVPGKMINSSVDLAPGAMTTLGFQYLLTADKVEIELTDQLHISAPTTAYWEKTTSFQSDNDFINHLFRSAAVQITSNMAANGRLDASIWQYNLEWVRDQSFIAMGLVLAGQFEHARVLLQRLLTHAVSPEGDTIDSGQRREAADVELDQNGELLTATALYTNWTGDLSLLKDNWPTIERVADFPFRPEFVHQESGMLHNRREYWERSALHGVEDGFELMYQMWVSRGLRCASELATRLGHEETAKRWQKRAQDLKTTILQHPRYGMIDRGRLVKRKGLDGEVQHNLQPESIDILPPGVPLSQPIPHPLNPDSSAALLIAWEEIDPQDLLARETFADLEKLWNQRWSGGGYGRYHIDSEPDSPGPWPFASLFIARAYCQANQTAAVWRVLHWLEKLPGAESGTFFEFYGKRPIPPCPQVGFTPWTFAETLLLLVYQILGIRTNPAGVQIRPRLLTELGEIKCNLRMGGYRLNLRISSNLDKGMVIEVEGSTFRLLPDGVELPALVRDVTVRMAVPAGTELDKGAGMDK